MRRTPKARPSMGKIVSLYLLGMCVGFWAGAAWVSHPPPVLLPDCPTVLQILDVPTQTPHLRAHSLMAQR